MTEPSSTIKCHHCGAEIAYRKVKFTVDDVAVSVDYWYDIATGSALCPTGEWHEE